MKKAILFDNDGVLVNTEPLYFQATREMCAQLGKELSLEEFIACHITSSRATWHLLDIAESAIGQWRAWRNGRYGELLRGQKNLAYEGLTGVLERLNAKYRMCVVTSSTKVHFDEIHRSNVYLDSFEFVLTLEDVSMSKPSPEPYLKALARLGLKASECIVVEDTYRGLKSAQAAGLDCVMLRNEFSAYQDLSGANGYIDALEELPELMASF